jgi:uncharacterized protein
MRTTKSDLLRLVVMSQGPTRIVKPDPRGTAPGRGAHLHPTTACLDLAVRRKAFARALRVPAPLETAPVRDYVEQVSDGSSTGSSGRGTRPQHRNNT